MKKLSGVYNLAYVIIFAILMVSCQHNKEVNASEHKTNGIRIVRHGNNSEEDYGSSIGIAENLEAYSDYVVKYRIINGDPYQLYIVSIQIDATNLIFQNGTIQISVLIDDPSDINGMFTSNRLEDELEYNNVINIKKVVTLDEKGELGLLLNIGTAQNRVRGSYIINSISIDNVENDSTYEIFTSSDETVQMILLEKDINTSNISEENIQSATETLSRLRQSIKALVGGKEPYNGITNFVCTENIPFTGLAGNPIYIKQEDICILLRTLQKVDSNNDIFKTDFIPVFCHEMSHTFDGVNSKIITGSYNFDKEFFATLKEIYALYINNFNISYDFVTPSPPLKSGIYNHETFLYKIMEFLNLLENNENWDAIKDTLIAFDDYKPATANKYDSFYKFIDILSDKSGIDLKSCFTDVEWDTLCNYFDINNTNDIF